MADNCPNNHGEYEGTECPSCADGVPNWEAEIAKFSDVEITSEDGLYMCCWSFDGEGFCGDFDESDPEDQPLLRFTLYKWQMWSVPENDVTGEWEAIDDASYCTQNPVNTSLADLEKMANELLYEAARAGNSSCKKAMEAASWITP